MNDAITQISLKKLHPFDGHPYKVTIDEKLHEMAASIKMEGMHYPIIARPLANGDFEILSGHRRKAACEFLGIDTIPAIIKEMTDDEAALAVVNSNLHRDHLLPSERAFAGKMKLDALKRTAGRPSAANAPQVAANYRSDDEVAKAWNMSGDTLRRYIRLTKLIPECEI